jgi:hypothetical protein
MGLDDDPAPRRRLHLTKRHPQLMNGLSHDGCSAIVCANVELAGDGGRDQRLPMFGK